MLYNPVLDFLKNTIESVARVSVKALMGHTFKVDTGIKELKVSNFPKVSEIKGKVSVTNQKDVENILKQLLKRQEELNKKLLDEIKTLRPKDKITVENLKDIPRFPDTVSLKNPSKTVAITNLYEVVKELGKIQKNISDLPQKYPEVKIPPYPQFPKFPEIRIPEYPTEIEVKNLEKYIQDLFHEDPEKYVPVRLTDGKEFYNALESIAVSASRQSFRTSDGKKVEALVDSSHRIEMGGLARFVNNDVIEQTSSLVYMCMETSSGEWMIQRIDTSSHNEFRYATERNNADITTYSEAFDNYLDLTYGLVSEAL